MSANELLGLPEPSGGAGFERDGVRFGTLSAALGKVGAGPAILDPKEGSGGGYAFHEDWLRHRPNRGKHLRMVQVDKRFGDSMVPTIYPGSMLAVDLGPGGAGYAELGPHEGKIFLVRPDPDDEHGGMVVKRVYLQDGSLVLVSDNLHTKPRLQVIPLRRRPLQRFLLGRVVHIARDEE
jgi:phage repressor protein C with HTH and peptisase S24 domain